MKSSSPLFKTQTSTSTNIEEPNTCKVLITSGFHRSATSATALLLAEAGLPMGVRLMGGDISNPLGHYEDLDMVKLHDQLLSEAGTTWQFHDEVSLQNFENRLFAEYVEHRDSLHGTDWGAKDPRSCLFLNQWDAVLGNRGRYLFVVRHWSACIESLLNRHSRALAHGLLPVQQMEQHLKFWQQPDLAARMWLSYNRRIFLFMQHHRENSVLISQRSLFSNPEILQSLNTRLGLYLESHAPAKLVPALLNDHADNYVIDSLSTKMITELDTLWENLLLLSDHHTEDETPHISHKSLCSAALLNSYHKECFRIQNDSVVSDFAVEPLVDIDLLLSHLDSCKTPKDINILLKPGNPNSQLTSNDDIKKITDWVSTNFKLSSEVYFTTALWLQGLLQWQLALDHYERALCLGLIAPHVFMRIGLCYQEVGDYNLALHYFDIAINRNPNNSAFYSAKAGCLLRLGHLNASLDLFKQAYNLAPENITVLIQYCVALEQAGREKDALNLAKSNINDQEHIGLSKLITRLFFKHNIDLGIQNYFDSVKQKMNERDQVTWLAHATEHIGIKMVEQDFLSRIEAHWVDLI